MFIKKNIYTENNNDILVKKYIIGLFITLGVPFSVFFFPKGVSFIYIELFFWSIFILTIIWVTKIENNKLSSLEIKELNLMTIKNIFICTFCLILGVIIFSFFRKFFPISIEGFQRENLKTLIYLRAGIVEEVLFRGYAITRIILLTKRTVFAVVITTLLFTLMHIKAGLSGILISLILGTILSLFFIWKKDLISNISSHCIVDLLFAS